MLISIVILNFSRPAYIKNEIIPKLEKMDKVDEIIISHGKEKTYFKSKCSKVVNLKHWGKDFNDKYGLTLRFLSASQAKNKYVMIMDDDIIPTEETVNFLLERIEEDDERIYGLYGRNIDKEGHYSYTNYFGEVPIILTRCMVTSREMCNYFMENFRKYENELITASKPYWNGEDILFSLMSVQKNSKLGKAYDLKHTNRIWNYLNVSESISVGGNHNQYRKKITKRLIEDLRVKDKIRSSSKKKYWKTQVTYFVENSVLIYFIYIFALFWFSSYTYYYIFRI